MSIALVNIIFGMKIRQARVEANLTLTEFAKQAELSPSYATEIEKGRKYPRANKILKMAEVLGKDYDELVSIKLDPSLAYLESTLSSSILQNFPFAEFGLEASDLVGLLTREPDKASALLHGIVAVGRRYAVTEEQFLRAAMRSYQEVRENYFPEVEEAAVNFQQTFGKTYELDAQEPISLAQLEAILQKEYGYTIDYETIGSHPELKKYRSVYFQGKKPKLLINHALFGRQMRFVLAREIGYQFLGLTVRSHTSTPDQIKSFEQILNDFKASYFAGALLMPRTAVLDDLQQFFDLQKWDPQPLEQMLTKYNVSPEMLLYRFSELIPQFFGVKLHFLRFQQTKGSQNYQLIKQLNMNQLIVPSGIGLDEHYCLRWLSVRLLQDLEARAGQTDSDHHILDDAPAGVQMSEYLDSRDRFLCIGFARPLVLTPDVYSSVIVGFRVDNDLKNSIRFMNDPAVPNLIINETCERCPLTTDQCHQRASEPTALLAKQQERQRKLALDQLRTRALSE
ncbi:MAG: XRE family transcriptional regulator [Chloroflexota bacterium]